MEIVFLGSGKEVGRSAIMVKTGNESFLLDYGVDVQDMSLPIKAELPTAVFLTHSHIDHSGHIPSLYKRGYKGNVYATPATFSLCSLLLRDSLKVQKKKGLTPNYQAHDLERMEELKKNLKFQKPANFNSASVELHFAGHVPGAASILLESRRKRILYTGDINFKETALMKQAFTDFKDIDVVICESTYSYKNHPDRKKLADRLRKTIQDTVYNNGIVLLPSFAVGRTQEMLSMVYDLGFPIYLDGMGIDATERILQHPNSVKNPEKLRRAFSMARKLGSASKRKNAISKPCIIISTAGMLSGGPINFYMKRLHQREDCTMILNGFQVPGTVGRILLDTGRYIYEDIDVKPKMKVEFMDFSAHCGHDGIINFLKKLSPEKVFLIHGERTEEFSQELNGMGFDASAPNNGDKVNI